MMHKYHWQLINMDGIEFKPSDMRTNRYIITASSPVCIFAAVASRFPQLLKCDTDMVVSYCVVPYLRRYHALLVTGNAVHDY